MNMYRAFVSRRDGKWHVTAPKYYYPTSPKPYLRPASQVYLTLIRPNRKPKAMLLILQAENSNSAKKMALEIIEKSAFCRYLMWELEVPASFFW